MAALLLPLLVLLCGAAMAAGTCQKAVDPADAQALLDVKAELDDPDGALDTWTAADASNACCWTFVTCNSTRVSDLYLANLDLGGALPQALGNLTKLKYLQLDGNALEGPIPATWSAMANLTDLLLSNNFLNGSLNIVSSFPLLNSLRVRNNSFTGEIGKVPLANLTALQYVDLASNAFTGTFPTWLGNLQALGFVDISNNDLSPSTLPSADSFWPPLLYNVLFSAVNLVGPIPATLCSRRIYTLDLSSNNLNGSIPQWTGNQSEVILNFSRNSLTGVLPTAEKDFSSIDFSHNKLSGNITAFSETLCRKYSISNDSGLYNFVFFFLDLSNNKFNGPIPGALGSCMYLANIFLGNNSFNGSVPESLFNSSPSFGRDLITLDLSNNSITSLPELTFEFSGLTKLNLEGNQLTNVPVSLFNFTALEILNLARNRLSSVPAVIEELTVLEELYLQGNNISGSVPAFVGNMSTLTTMDFSDNSIDGLPDFTEFMTSATILKVRGNELSSLPASLCNLTQLEILDVGENQLTAAATAIGELTWLQELYLDSNAINGSIPAFIGNISFLQVLDLSNNFFTAEIPDTFASKEFGYDESLQFYKFISFVALRYMNLSRCNLTGSIPANLGNLQRLLTLDLSSNQLSGEIPDFQYTSLAHLDLSANALNGSVPTSLANLSLSQLDLSGNKLSGFLPAFDKTLLLCENYQPGNSDLQISCVNGYAVNDIPPPPPSPSPPPPSKSGLPVYVIVCITLGIVLLVSIAIVLAYLYFRPRKSEFAVKLKDHFVKQIRLQNIREATDNFSEKNLLGVGGYGSVYKGVTKSGEIWAVKRAKTVSVEGLQVFQNEVDVISRMNHKHLVKLLGFCDEDNEQILIYEFVENGTLKSALQLKDGGRTPLTFKQRLEIALGSAEGLAYLHTQAKPTIIHRDVKSDNILLDARLQAKVADFGLLKDNEEESASARRTRVAGTHGYMDPEYYTTFKVTPKSDVYSFGVVILELITGQPALITQTDGDLTSLAGWALQRIRSSLGLAAIADPTLDGNFSLDDMQTLASIAASCLQKVSAYRPEMADVASQLRMLKAKGEGAQGPGQPPIQPEEHVEVTIPADFFRNQSNTTSMVQEQSVVIAR